MTHKIDLSVIICTKDRPDEINRCVDFLLDQTVKEFELIIVDASSDGVTGSILKRKLGMAKDGICFRYIRSAAWLTRQRNMGIEKASGEILVFLDDDVVVEKDYLENHHRVYEMDTRKSIAGVGGIFLNVKPYSMPKQLFHKLFLLPTGDKKQRMLSSGFATHIIQPSEITNVEVLNGGNTSYRKAIFNSFKFDENFEGYGYMEDDDFSYRVSRVHKLCITPFARSKHFVSDKGKDSLEHRMCLEVKNHYYFFMKNMEQNIKTWMFFIWSEIGCLLKYLLGFGFNAFILRTKACMRTVKAYKLQQNSSSHTS